MLSVVVVDDCPCILDAVVSSLSDIDGVDTIISGSALCDVISIVSAMSQKNMLMLIVDYHLETECGLDVARAITATRDVEPSVVIMTGDSHEDIKRNLVNLPYRLMQKPFTFGDLTTEVNRVMDTRSKRFAPLRVGIQ